MGPRIKITQVDESNGNKWWAWKDSNLRPADYESSGLVVLMGETWRFLRGFSMQISPVFETRDYTEIYLWFINEIEPELIALISPKASPRKELWQTELWSEPELVPKSGA